MSAQKDTYLVTGGLGFIGSHVVEDILQQTNQNVVIIDFNQKSPNIPLFDMCKRVSIIYIDITSPYQEIVEALQPYQTLIHTCIHLAAAISVEESVNDPEKYEKTNVEGSRTVYQWCTQHGVRTVVSASSAAVYGTPKALPCREEDVSEKSSFLSPYAESKFKMELVGKEIAPSTGTVFTFLRFFNVYGPRQDPKNPYTGVISKFMDFSVKGQPIIIFGDGKQTRDFVFVKDITNAILRSAEKHSTLNNFNVFNVCTGSQCSIQQLATHCMQLPGSFSENIEYRSERAGDIKYSYGDNTLLVREVGWDYRFTLNDGLIKTWEWFQENEKKMPTKFEMYEEVSTRAGVGIV